MRFSVIIPLYNKAPYVEKAIDSVFRQTLQDFELIVVDDGSTDSSATIARACMDGHKNVSLLRQQNNGVSFARNNGVVLTDAPYLCFLDADDWWEPTFLEEMGRLIDDFPDAGIYGTNYTIINETKRKTRVAPIGLEDGFEKGYINYCKAYSAHLGMPLTSSSVCIKRTVFNEMGGFPEGITLGEDFLLWIHVALKYKVAFLNKPLANYNQDAAAAQRAVGHLHSPQKHMLWNLQDLELSEKTNPDLKLLLDRLRTNVLMPYFLSSEYHENAVTELSKVDWSQLPESARHNYDRPLWALRLKSGVYRILSRFKVFILRLFR